MQAVRYHRTGTPGVLRVETVDRPTPGEDEVLVDVRAASVNPIEIRFRSGRYEPNVLPMIPGTDFAGVVADVGPGVDAYHVGDPVLGAGLDKGGPYQGAYAEFAVAPVGMVAPLPSDVSFETAAAVGHVGSTAWHSLLATGDPTALDTCLVHGGSGGVGHVAVQLASLAGARVVSTAGSDRKRQRVRELGADVVIDYRRDDLTERILDACESLGRPNVVLDHRLHDYLQVDIDVAAVGATIVSIAGDDVEFTNTSAAVSKDLTVRFTGTSKIPDPSEVLRRLGRLLGDGQLTVDIAETFDFTEAAAAQRMVSEESYVGKVVLTVD